MSGTAQSNKASGLAATHNQTVAGLDPATWAVTWGRGRKRALVTTLQFFGEGAGITFAVLIAYLMEYSWPPSMGQVVKSPINAIPLLIQVVRSVEFAPFLPLLLVAPLLYLLILQSVRIYRQNLSDIQPFAAGTAILRGTLLGTVLLGLLSTTLRVPQPASSSFSIMFFTYLGLLVFFGVLLFHAATLIGLLCLHSFNIGRSRVAVITDEDLPVSLIEALRSPATSFHFVGAISLNPELAKGSTVSYRKLGSLDKLASLINSHDLDELILAVDPQALSTTQRLEIAQTCWRMGGVLKMVTPFHPFFRTSAQPERIGEVSVLHIENVGLYATTPQLIKRAMDLIIAGTALIAVSPVMLVTAALIKLTSPGPVFFVQERVGLNGRTFRMIKFRSMRTNSDPNIHKEYLKKLIQGNEVHSVDKDGKPIYKIAKDPRITPIGQIIRKTSIDEFPQFFNVLRGEMSLVGPRPPIQYEVDEYQDWHLRRLHIRPGLTGLWQVSGRNRLSFEEMVRLDISYIETWSLWLDIKIIFRTIFVLLNIGQSY